jgi:acetate kinase
MGFTPLEGLAMATRSGTVDPGLILWLVEHQGIAPAEISDGLEHRSGLLGLAGTDDMRVVADRVAQADPAAVLALSVYLHRLRAGIAAMAAALGGIDALTFTGGVGEGSPLVRSAAAEGLGFLGIGLEAGRNRETQPVDREIGRTGAAVRSFVIAAREDLEIARQVRQVLETS